MYIYIYIHTHIHIHIYIHICLCMYVCMYVCMYIYIYILYIHIYICIYIYIFIYLAVWQYSSTVRSAMAMGRACTEKCGAIAIAGVHDSASLEKKPQFRNVPSGGSTGKRLKRVRLEKSRFFKKLILLVFCFLSPKRTQNSRFEPAVVEKSSWRSFLTIGLLFSTKLHPRKWLESVSGKPNELRTEQISNRTNNDCWVYK